MLSNLKTILLQVSEKMLHCNSILRVNLIFYEKVRIMYKLRFLGNLHSG